MAQPKSVKTKLSNAEKILALGAGGLLIALLVLFQLIKIDGAVIAKGQAVVTGKPREVQSLDGGIVQKILVAEGDVVTAGDVLIRLDPSLLQINRDILLGRLTGLVAREARLDAELRDLTSVALPDTLPGINRDALLEHIDGQREIFAARQAVQASQKQQQEERIVQQDSTATGLRGRILAVRTQIEILQQEVARYQDLAAQGLVADEELFDKQSRLAGLQGEMEALRSDLAATHNVVRDAELKITQSNREFREAVATELREVTDQIEEVRLEIASIENQLARLNILAPVSGVVHEMQLATVGGVVPPRQTILKVVPVADGVNFVLEVPPEAVDTVYVGQPARVRFPAFDQRTTPELSGTVSLISPDSINDQTTANSFYKVNLLVTPEELTRLGDHAVIPGMPVEALLQTGERSIMSYLIKPFTDHMALAFREG